MSFWTNLARNLVRDVVAPELETLLGKVCDATALAQKAVAAADAAVGEVKSLRKQLATLMAIEPGFGAMGKAVILARVGDQDRVKILDIKPELTLAEYKALVEQLKAEYGVKEPAWGTHTLPGLDDVVVGAPVPIRRRQTR
jgi:hypothetical protein